MVYEEKKKVEEHIMFKKNTLSNFVKYKCFV